MTTEQISACAVDVFAVQTNIKTYTLKLQKMKLCTKQLTIPKRETRQNVVLLNTIARKIFVSVTLK